jgi:hypothetical protein
LGPDEVIPFQIWNSQPVNFAVFDEASQLLLQIIARASIASENEREAQPRSMLLSATVDLQRRFDLA